MLERMRATQATWRERVKEWRDSGLKASDFAEAKGLRASTLRYWASRLKRLDAPASITMARVVVQSATTTGPELEVAVGDARIVLRRGFDAQLLREVVSALGVAR